MSLNWSREWQEKPGPDEDENFARFAGEVGAIAREVAERTRGDVGRVFHVKKHVGVVGKLRVLSGLAPPLASGVFAESRDYDCYVRFSNGAVRGQPDGVLDVRGVALKLVDVRGARAGHSEPDDEPDRAHTQDFLFVQAPAVPTDSFDEFLALARASVGGPGLLPLKLCVHAGVAPALRILMRLAAVPQPRSLAGGTYFSAVPVMLGLAAAKLRLAPLTQARERKGDDYRSDLVTRVREGGVRFAVQAQLYTDERRTPIESASIAWRGEFHDVATLEIPAQDPEGVRGRAVDEMCDRLSFNPWHALAAHRPLGKTQRARAAAYRVSSEQRRAAPEPLVVLPHDHV